MTRTAPVVRSVVAALALAATALLSPAAPAGARGLVASVTLAPAGSEVALATDAVGSAVVAWVAGGQVQVARRAAGASLWSPVTTVSPAGEAASAPDVSVGSGGDAAVVWTAVPTGGASVVKIVVQPAGQGWGAARSVSETNQPVSSAQVEMGSTGVATVVWASRNATNAVVRTKTASATTISAQTMLAEATGAFSGVSLARNAAGDIVAAWRLEGAAGYPQAARRLAGAAWQTAPVFTAAATVPDRTGIAVDGNGNATLGWSQGVDAASATPYLAAWPRGQAGFSPPSGLSGSPAGSVHVAATGSGVVAATWSGPTGLWYADSGSAPVALSGPVAAHDLAISESGAATVAYAPPGAGLTVAHRPAGAAWSSSPVPSAGGSLPAVGAHAGDATLAWAEGGAGAVHTSTLDSGAPTAVHMTAPLRVLNHGKRILAGWIGADTWSPITYEVARQVATYRSPLDAAATWLTTTATGAAYAAKPGQTVCLRVRGVDAGGNVSAWSVPRCATVAVNDRTLTQKKLGGRSVWKTVKQAKGSYSKDYTQTRAKGATLTLRAQARRVALLVSTGRGHGSVSVSLGKSRLGTFSLASAKPAAQVVIPVAVFSGVRDGKLKVVVTTDGKPVKIDGVYVGPS